MKDTVTIAQEGTLDGAIGLEKLEELREIATAIVLSEEEREVAKRFFAWAESRPVNFVDLMRFFSNVVPHEELEGDDTTPVFLRWALAQEKKEWGSVGLSREPRF